MFRPFLYDKSYKPLSSRRGSGLFYTKNRIKHRCRQQFPDSFSQIMIIPPNKLHHSKSQANHIPCFDQQLTDILIFVILHIKKIKVDLMSDRTGLQYTVELIYMMTKVMTGTVSCSCTGAANRGRCEPEPGEQPKIAQERLLRTVGVSVPGSIAKNG